jgi:MFS family permease
MRNVMAAPIGAAMTFRIVRDLGATPAAFGLTITGLGVGTIVGSLFAARLGAGTNVFRVLIVSVAVIGLVTALSGVIPSVAAVVVLSVVSGAAEAVLVVVYVSVRAANSPEVLVGRIGSTARVMALGLQPAASLLGGALIDAIGGSGTLVVFGVATCLFALAFTRLDALRGASLAPSTPPAVPNPIEPIPGSLER